MIYRRPRYDHFHLCYELPDGTRGEVEGGFTAFPDDWETYTEDQRKVYYHSLGVDWGMPTDASLVSFRLAG